MHLLSVDPDGSFRQNTFIPSRIPRYAILSHTWEADDQEVTYDDLRAGTGSHKTGYRKIQFCAEQARRDGIQYFWVDSCCIDKSSSAELTEAINSMFRWYQDADKCYVYLSDVSASGQVLPAFKQSRWFTRGWTLQELLAPQWVEFYVQEGTSIGDKQSLETEISQVTGIPALVLQGRPLSELSVHERMLWIDGRQTTKPEDKAYSLLGIFGVHLPLIYGEGEANAFRRLEEELDRPIVADQMEQFRREDERNAAIRWASPSDLVGDFHQGICNLRQKHTGNWFLKSKGFARWRKRPNSVLWLRGNAGCGKTVLCSSIITDIYALCKNTPGSYLAYFYFSFSDIQRQSVESLLRVVVRQILLQRDTILADFRDVWKRYMHSNPPVEAWLEILQGFSRHSGQMFIIIDALDECPVHRDERNLLLRSLEKLTKSQIKNLHLLVTSRDERHIGIALKSIVTSPPLNFQNSHVDHDIRLHVQAQLRSHPIMSAWPLPVRKEVEDVLTEKAGGMFRWVACQIESLQACQRASAVRKALKTLPKTLDETYERMIVAIRPETQQEAIAALTWLVFSKRPMTVEELAEASVIDITSTTVKPFETEERLFNPNSIVEILSGLISIMPSAERSPTVRLAHFSVEEYLVSDRIKTSPASPFQLSFGPAVQSLAAGCLYYLLSPEVTLAIYGSLMSSSTKFPLMRYAANYWHIYVRECQRPMAGWLTDVIMKFLECRPSFGLFQLHWDKHIIMDQSDAGCLSAQWYDREQPGPGPPPIYYACCLGMTDVVQRLLNTNSARNKPNQTSQAQDLGVLPGRYADELRAACHHGHEEIVSMLLEAGADASAVGGNFETALNAAMNTASPNEQIIIQLLEVEDRLQASDFLAGWLMRWAVGHGHLRAVKLMLQKVKGFEPSFKWTVVNSSTRSPDDFFEGVKEQRFGPFQWGDMPRTTLGSDTFSTASSVSYINHCSAPYQAVLYGQTEIVQTLVEYWTNIDEQDHEGRTALYWAAFRGDAASVRLLLEKGARPDVPVRVYGWRAMDWANPTIRQLLEDSTIVSKSSGALTRLARRVSL